MNKIATIILAAGQGKRMKSDLPKVLHKVLGRPMILYVIDVAKAIDSVKIVVVIGHKRELVKKKLAEAEVDFAVQEEQLGTAHAVQQAEKVLGAFSDDVLILSGDVPLLREERVRELIDLHHEAHAAATLLVGTTDKPEGYGRIIRDDQGFVDRIVEDKDATEYEKKINEVNVGTYIFDYTKLRTALPRVKNENIQQEFYLPDVIKILRANGERIAALATPDFTETMGINTIEQLKEVEQILNTRVK